MPKGSRESGFTLTELMVVVAMLCLISVLAVPKLGRDRQAGEALRYARNITKALEIARLRAVSTRRPYVVAITDRNVTTSWKDPSNSLHQEAVVQAPNQGLVWDARTAPALPVAPQAPSATVQFNPDFTVSVNNGASINAYIYVASNTGAGQGRQATIQVIGSGAIRMWETW
jgi:type II secretion system protein H